VELDGHRAVAVLGMVVFNVYQFSNVDHFLYGGTIAYTVLDSLDAMVPWLFVLSAFLLFEPIARAAIEDPGAISVSGFLTRRAVRILPLYYVAVAVVWFCRQSSLPGDWRDLLEHVTFTQVFDEQRIFYTIGPAWAISVEVLFCLLLACLMVGLRHVCARLATRRQRILILTVCVSLLGALSLGWSAWAFWIAHRPTTAAFTTWFGPLSNLAEFAVGMAVGLLLAVLGDRHRLGPRSRLVLRLIGAAILCLAFAAREPDTWTGAYFYTLTAVGFGCLVSAAVLGPPDRFSRALSVRPLPWIAVIAYSVYVWHEPIMLALHSSVDLVRPTYAAFPLDVVVVVGASLVLGRLSYLFIQRPTLPLEEIGRHRKLVKADARAESLRSLRSQG
jgi:peptidoglycan/LPS O-acetylase OafA/YrhL